MKEGSIRRDLKYQKKFILKLLKLFREKWSKAKSYLTKNYLFSILNIYISGFRNYFSFSCSQLLCTLSLSLYCTYSEITIIKGLELGTVGYVTKPFNESELMIRINVHLQLKETEYQIENNTKTKNITIFSSVNQKTQIFVDKYMLYTYCCSSSNRKMLYNQKFTIQCYQHSPQKAER